MRRKNCGNAESFAAQGHKLYHQRSAPWVHVHDDANVSRLQLFPIVAKDFSRKHDLFMFRIH